MHRNPTIAIAAADSSQRKTVAQLAQQLQLPVVAISNRDYDFLLVKTPAWLELREISNLRTRPLYIDFLQGEVVHRQKYGGGRGQLIARAVGIKKDFVPTVLDLTAGLGKDAFVLASLGCKVTMLERSPIVAALLKDGLERAQQVVDSPARNMQLVHADALSYLKQLAVIPEVIYIDPMYPPRSKTALGKKEFRILHVLVGADEDAALLLAPALTGAKKRIVVKRPRLADYLGGIEPSIQFKGKSSRFDVYLI